MRQTRILVLCGACLALACMATDGSDVVTGGLLTVQLDDGEFHAYVPHGFDGTSSLPAVVYLHGHGGDAHDDASSEAWTAELEAAGAIGVFPQGAAAGNWKVGHHAEQIERSDIAFLEQVATHVRARWPVDSLWLAGHSEGASMVYESACASTGVWDGVQPMSGSFWLPAPDDCDLGSIPAWHRHGAQDGTWPYEGGDSSIGTKSGVEEGLQRLAVSRGCSDDWQDTEIDGRSCRIIEACSPSIRICMHEGGHGVPSGWLTDLLGSIEAPR